MSGKVPEAADGSQGGIALPSLGGVPRIGGAAPNNGVGETESRNWFRSQPKAYPSKATISERAAANSSGGHQRAGRRAAGAGTAGTAG